MVRSKLGQRLGGLIILALGAGATAWVWYTALTEGYHYRKAAFVFPCLAVFGLAGILFPIDVDRFRAEHGVEQATSFRQFPPAWKVVFVLALAAGFGNCFLLAF
jgi:hypothetical protein